MNVEINKYMKLRFKTKSAPKLSQRESRYHNWEVLVKGSSSILEYNLQMIIENYCYYNNILNKIFKLHHNHFASNKMCKFQVNILPMECYES